MIKRNESFVEFKEKNEKKASVRTVVFVIVSILVFAVLTLFLTAITLTRKTNDPPALFGYRFFIADYDSMKPTIGLNSLVIVKETDSKQLKLDDVITFVDHYDDNGEKVIVSSRIVELNPTESGVTFYTRADNSEITDQRLRKDADIFGKMVWTSSTVGGFIVFLKSPLGLILLVALPLLILLAVEIINLIRVHKAPYEQLDDGEYTAHMFGTHTKKGKRMDKSLTDLSEHIIEPPEPIDAEADDDYTELNMQGSINPTAAKILTKEDDRRDGFDQGFSIQTLADEQEVLNDMDSFAFIRTKKIVTKAEEDAEHIRVLNQYSNGSRKLAVITNSSETNFSSIMQPKGRDRFNIDGIDVKVEPKSLQLDFEENSSREISITVTKEYTNVVIECKEYEVNFALFKDEESDDDKVIIQRKPK